MEWSRRKKRCRFCAGHTTNPRNRDVKRFRGWRLFPLAPCKSILNTFVYEIYQRVFILFELSVKHTLSDFLLPFRCHTTIWHFNCIGFIILIFRQLYSQILNFLLLDHSLHFLYIHYIFHFGFHLFLGQLLNQYQSF